MKKKQEYIAASTKARILSLSTAETRLKEDNNIKLEPKGGKIKENYLDSNRSEENLVRCNFAHSGSEKGGRIVDQVSK